MKHLSLSLPIIALLLLVSCGKQTKQITLEGKDGKNGHSLVSMYNETSELECQNGGMRLDVYLDLNDDLMASEGDSYSNSLVACNGENGMNGEDGEQGLKGEVGQAGPQGIGSRLRRDTHGSGHVFPELRDQLQRPPQHLAGQVRRPPQARRERLPVGWGERQRSEHLR